MCTYTKWRTKNFCTSSRLAKTSRTFYMLLFFARFWIDLGRRLSGKADFFSCCRPVDDVAGSHATAATTTFARQTAQWSMTALRHCSVTVVTCMSPEIWKYADCLHLTGDIYDHSSLYEIVHKSTKSCTIDIPTKQQYQHQSLKKAKEKIEK